MTTITLESVSLPMTTAQANTTYTLDAGHIRSNGETLMDLASTQGLRFDIDGTLISDKSILLYGEVYKEAAAVDMTIGETALLHGGQSGVFIGADNSRLENDGFIQVEQGGRAAYLYGDGTTLINTGTMITSGNAAEAVFLFGDDVFFDNSGTIKGTLGVIVNSQSGWTSKFVNSGEILSTGGGSVILRDGDDTMVNSGLVNNGVSLGEGDDTFVSRGGRVLGVVNGDDGDDTYVIRNNGVVVGESLGHGFDRMKASVSFTLADNVEEGWLLGRRNLSLTGTGGVDILYGNKGDNRLFGGMAADFITGGRGNDRLTGGDALGTAGDSGDTFVFRNHSGHDAITDFQDGMDVINLGGYDGIQSFADLDGHVHQHGDDAVVSLLGHDRITIRHMDAANLSELDFDF